MPPSIAFFTSQFKKSLKRSCCSCLGSTVSRRDVSQLFRTHPPWSSIVSHTWRSIGGNPSCLRILRNKVEKPLPDTNAIGDKHHTLYIIRSLATKGAVMAEVMSAAIGFIGAVLGGGMSLIAARQQWNYTRQDQQRNEKKLVKGYLFAIRDEVTTLWNRYQETVGKELDKTAQHAPFIIYYPVLQDYFTVYNGNSFLLGRVKDDSLRNAIVRTYTLSKGLVDSYRMNNEFVAKLELANNMFAATKEAVYQQQAASYVEQLKMYGDTLRHSHLIVKAEIDRLQEHLSRVLNGELNGD
jgi:hypothetical protein